MLMKAQKHLIMNLKNVVHSCHTRRTQRWTRLKHKRQQKEG